LKIVVSPILGSDQLRENPSCTVFVRPLKIPALALLPDRILDEDDEELEVVVLPFAEAEVPADATDPALLLELLPAPEPAAAAAPL
jgi:hypothetical protein